MVKKYIISLLAVIPIVGTTYSQVGKPVFSTIKQNPITSVKNQNRSGTCWAYATVGFFESEILRQTGRTYDLSEMFVANKNYADCAVYHVRMHGDSRFSEGGSCDDVLAVIQEHGICPENAMALPGSMTGDSLANFTEFFQMLEPYVTSVARSHSKKLSTQWKAGLQSILDAYLGPCPEEFDYEGKHYTPKTFAASLGLQLDNYVSITSFTHHPFYTNVIIEAPYKWRPRLSYNVPLHELMAIIDDALEQGYHVAWGGDVSESGFNRKGIGIACQDKAAFDSLGVQAPELEATQELRQKRFDTWDTTYDHVMLIFGRARDQFGREYYMVKNSWGETGDYEGIWYMSRNFIALNTIYIFLNRDAIRQ